MQAQHTSAQDAPPTKTADQRSIPHPQPVCTSAQTATCTGKTSPAPPPAPTPSSRLPASPQGMAQPQSALPGSPAHPVSVSLAVPPPRPPPHPRSPSPRAAAHPVAHPMEYSTASRPPETRSGCFPHPAPAVASRPRSTHTPPGCERTRPTPVSQAAAQAHRSARSHPPHTRQAALPRLMTHQPPGTVPLWHSRPHRIPPS